MAMEGRVGKVGEWEGSLVDFCGVYLTTGHKVLMPGLDSKRCETERQPSSYSYSRRRRVVISDLVRYAFSESIFSMAGVAQLGEQQTEA
jgi:hypothetical protein